MHHLVRAFRNDTQKLVIVVASIETSPVGLAMFRDMLRHVRPYLPRESIHHRFGHLIMCETLRKCCSAGPEKFRRPTQQARGSANTAKQTRRNPGDPHSRPEDLPQPTPTCISSNIYSTAQFLMVTTSTAQLLASQDINRLLRLCVHPGPMSSHLSTISCILRQDYHRTTNGAILTVLQFLMQNSRKSSHMDTGGSDGAIFSSYFPRNYHTISNYIVIDCDTFTNDSSVCLHLHGSGVQPTQHDRDKFHFRRVSFFSQLKVDLTKVKGTKCCDCCDYLTHFVDY
jgi:hypothetical protein